MLGIKMEMNRPSTIFVQKKFPHQELLVAEIGVRAGLNASSIFSMLQLKQLYLVDPWKPYKHVVPYGNGFLPKLSDTTVHLPLVIKKFKDCSNVTIMQLDSLKAAPKFTDGYFDFVYIDAAHNFEAVKNDILAWFPKVKADGVLGGHDYNLGDSRYCAGVIRAVDWFVEANKIELYHKDPDW